MKPDTVAACLSPDPYVQYEIERDFARARFSGEQCEVALARAESFLEGVSVAERMIGDKPLALHRCRSMILHAVHRAVDSVYAEGLVQ